MTKTVNRHVGEETAEKYSLSILSARKVAEVEKHLLICESCRQAVTASDAYIGAMRMAVAKMRKAEQKPGRKMAGN
jgi:hypothetical protein